MAKIYQLGSLFLFSASLAGFPAYLQQVYPHLQRWAISSALVSFFLLIVAALGDDFFSSFLGVHRGYWWGILMIVFSGIICGGAIQ